MRYRSLAAACTVLAPLLVVAPALAADGPAPGAADPVEPHVVERPLEGVVSERGPQAGDDGAGAVLSGAVDARGFDVLGVTWEAPDEGVDVHSAVDEHSADDVHVEVRTRQGDGWGTWTDAGAESDEGPDRDSEEGRASRDGSAPVWVGDADAVQVRVVAHDGELPSDVSVALVDPGESSTDAAVAAPPPAASASAATPRPAIRTRAQWGADESLRGRPSYTTTVQAMAVHHTASANGYAQADVPRLLRGFYAYHTQTRGWSDMGYQFLVDSFGTIWEGRHGGVDRPVLGAHAGGFNSQTSAVSLIGNYDSAAPSSRMLDAAADVIAWKLSTYGRDPMSSVSLTSAGSTRYAAGTRVTLRRVFGHRDVSLTSCPGDLVYRQIADIRTRVARRMSGAAAAPAPAPRPVATPTPPKNREPLGRLEGLRVTGVDRSGATVDVVGYALDPDTSSSVTVVSQVDGAFDERVVADLPRPDLVQELQVPERVGYAVTLRLSPGDHQVCTWAKDTVTGAAVRLGCRSTEVVVPKAPRRVRGR